MSIHDPQPIRYFGGSNSLPRRQTYRAYLLFLSLGVTRRVCWNWLDG